MYMSPTAGVFAVDHGLSPIELKIRWIETAVLVSPTLKPNDEWIRTLSKQ